VLVTPDRTALRNPPVIPGQPASRGPGRPPCEPRYRPGSGVAGLSEEHRRLLDLLAGGLTLAVAAQREHVSLRTVNRRVAEARTILGVTRTRDAVRVYRQPDGT
jgi:DNA-binding NarL/FixJ family response regulator